jgi:hypothetical protein
MTSIFKRLKLDYGEEVAFLQVASSNAGSNGLYRSLKEFQGQILSYVLNSIRMKY